jgi:hypothetical protein
MTNLRIPSHPHTIRFPDDLYWKVKLMSEKDSRNFNGEVIYLIELGYAMTVKARQAMENAVTEAVDELVKSGE